MFENGFSKFPTLFPTLSNADLTKYSYLVNLFGVDIRKPVFYNGTFHGTT
jgi:hypothetical protein